MIYRILSLLDGKITPLQGAVLKRMLEDVRPSFSFALDFRQRRAARTECQRCRTLDDYLAFTRKWLGVGAVQITEEIGATLEEIRSIAPKYVCEIGTEDGGTTFLFSYLLPSVELILGVDLYVQNRIKLNALHRQGQRLVLVNGSSQSLPTLQRVEKILQGKKLDVLFIDGDHRYEGVKQDFLIYRHLVRDGGLILFHDIVQDHAVRFGKVTPAYSGGVPTIWQELKQFYPYKEFIQDPEQNGMGIGVLRYTSLAILPEWFVGKK